MPSTTEGEHQYQITSAFVIGLEVLAAWKADIRSIFVNIVIPVTKTGFHIDLKVWLHKIGTHLLNINPQANWVGALPDGLVIDPSEQQANNGLVEIKCPASAKNTPLIDPDCHWNGAKETA